MVETCSVPRRSNTVDLSWSGGCFRGMTEGLAQAGDGRVEGLRFQVVLLAVDGAPQTAGPPRLNLPEGLVIGLRGLAGGGSGSLAASHRGGDRLGRRDDDDVLVVAQALGRGSAGGGPAFGREVAHLAFDDARIVPAATALGGHRGDLDQDQFSHASALARGTRRAAPAKTRRGREGDAGPPARYG